MLFWPTVLITASQWRRVLSYDMKKCKAAKKSTRQITKRDWCSRTIVWILLLPLR